MEFAGEVDDFALDLIREHLLGADGGVLATANHDQGPFCDDVTFPVLPPSAAEPEAYLQQPMFFPQQGQRQEQMLGYMDLTHQYVNSYPAAPVVFRAPEPVMIQFGGEPSPVRALSSTLTISVPPQGTPSGPASQTAGATNKRKRSQDEDADVEVTGVVINKAVKAEAPSPSSARVSWDTPSSVSRGTASSTVTSVATTSEGGFPRTPSSSGLEYWEALMGGMPLLSPLSPHPALGFPQLSVS
ncbi:unnamed protein product [Triticum turgidum subsp. durum]|uniref:Uncharacterized protein n=1 Tax=Triticum turgidum subsp. durum TaxID=4567 RepID=A0A9R1P2H2_TRITD|nr:unnamed protein product [Triticum turgidum subsp. durum]